ncbi:hypothetical protein IMSHALPRED_005054 [Imshaugia aleurites]|uniref:Uncharacterized protein n=1 Tax=Imshaugia aleurites TaxID=172621 RepID=A0A8H3FHH0_9LECA|nr:hypothetical protein IMSHALPRED_005054 [Imshaugia aleurites]
MAKLTFRFPSKTENNRKIGSICKDCRSTGPSAEVAANKLRDGIVHLTIDQLGEAQQNETVLTREDLNSQWRALINEATWRDFCCTTTLMQQIDCDELQAFWAATTVGVSEGENLSERQKKNKKKNEAKKWKAKNDSSPPPAVRENHHANHRRHKDKLARRKQAAGSTSTGDTTQAPLPDLTTAADPVKSLLGFPGTFNMTIASHPKTQK